MRRTSLARWPAGPSLLSACVNLPLLLAGLPRASYDTYTHIFFADHYRRWWFDLLEPRWFGGFSVASYPPLAHQLIAILSFPASVVAWIPGGTPGEIRLRGEAVAYGIVLALAVAWLPLAAQRFAAIFVPARAARTAGWLAVGLPSVYLTAYSFGQLPTLLSSAALMWAMADGWRFCRSGRVRDLLRAMLWAGVTATAHHAVLLFAIAAGAALAGRLLIAPPPTTSDDRDAQSRLRPAGAARRVTALRALVWAVCGAGLGAVVVWPFIQWSRGYIPQAAIDHLSRHNYLADWLAFYYFFLPMYGPILLALPLMARWSLSRRKRRHWPLLGAAALLFVLGLGGTTPLPRLLFGANWEWLTYDRFSLWAGLALLPFAGLLFHVYRPGGRALARRWRPGPGRAAPWFEGVGAGGLAAFCLLAASAAWLARSQPPARDLRALARFLNDPARRGDRYLTFGLGDQMAALSVLTDATTIDGTYFTARTIPELRRSGLGMLDGALWTPSGADAIYPFLERAADWGVRWAFTAHAAYVAPLTRSGWHYQGEIAPGVLAWRNPAEVTDRLSAHPVTDRRAALWWGVAPLLTLAAALTSTVLGRVRLARRPSPGGSLLEAGLWSLLLLLVLWPFWYFIPLWARDRPGVYFTYTSGLMFLPDLLAIVLVAACLAWRAWQRDLDNDPATSNWGRWGWPFWLAFLALVAFGLISAPGSVDPQLSFRFSVHLMAMGVVAWSANVATRSARWQPAAYALTAGLIIQSVVAVLQASSQTTAQLAPLGLKWPGGVEAETIGASVVGLAGGTRWLRAYGTLPHPNLLAGYLAVTLAGPLAGYAATGRARWLWPLALGAAATFLAFSRAGWLATAAAAAALAILLPPGPARRRALVAAGAMALVYLALAAALMPLVVTRVAADARSPQEAFSIVDRRALIGAAVEFIRREPVTGVGAGGFVPALAQATSLTPEAVHSVPLLAAAETGVGGGLAVAALALAVLLRAWRRRGQGVAEAAFGAGLIGLMVMGLFDHFAWSLSTGRLLAAAAAGLWAGAVGGADAGPEG